MYNAPKRSNTYFVKGDRIPLVSFNELGEKLRATNLLVNFMSNPKSNSYWLIVFENKITIGQSTFMWYTRTFDVLLIKSVTLFVVWFLTTLRIVFEKFLSLVKAHSRDMYELLMFSWLTLASLLVVSFVTHQRSTVRKYIVQIVK